MRKDKEKFFWRFTLGKKSLIKMKNEYYKEHLKGSEFYEAIVNCKNPYEKAIIGGEILNHQSTVLLKEYLNDKCDAQIQNTINSLPFSSKIDLMLAFYFIDKDHFIALKTINDIRNIFAHFIQGLTFDTAEISDEINKLTNLKLNQPDFYTRMEPEDKFSMIVTELYVYLFQQAFIVVKRKYIDKDPERIDASWERITPPKENNV